MRVLAHGFSITGRRKVSLGCKDYLIDIVSVLKGTEVINTKATPSRRRYSIRLVAQCAIMLFDTLDVAVKRVTNPTSPTHHVFRRFS